jgi:hypothetical protein
MTKRRSSKVGGNKRAQSKKARVARQNESAATDSLNGEALPREKANFKIREEILSPGRKGGHEAIGSTKRPSRVEPSRRNTAPKLAAIETTGLPRHIADERVLDEMHRGATSRVVRSAKIRATHGRKTSCAAEPLKKTSPARAEEKQVEHTISARPFEAVNNDGFGAAAEAVLSFCLKSIGFAARRMSVGLQLASNLARARDLSEVVELQTTYWRQQFDEVAAQIEESHSFITKVITGFVIHSTTSCEDKSPSACRSRSRQS